MSALCLYCPGKAETVIPSGSVCRMHAIEFFTTLQRLVQDRRIIREQYEQSSEYRETQAIVKACAPNPVGELSGSVFRQTKRRLIVAALERNGWVQRRAARDLGLSVRMMGYQIHRLGIEPPDWRRSAWLSLDRRVA